MSANHTFNLVLNWQAKSAAELAINPKAGRNHHIAIAGKELLEVSAAKPFKGDATLYNPEDLLLSSLASCHMMAYLYCCAQEKIELLSYTDHAEALLELRPDGGGYIARVVLKPSVIISDAQQIDLALSLHSRANKLCFIANSCNFPITHEATCEAEKPL